LQAVWNLNTLALVPIGSTAGVFSLAVAVIIMHTRVLPNMGGVDRSVGHDPGRDRGLLPRRRRSRHAPRNPRQPRGFLLSMLFILLLSIHMVLRIGKKPATA